MTGGIRTAPFGGGKAEEGYTRTNGTVELATTPATTTVVRHEGCGSTSRVFLEPEDSTSATARLTQAIWVQEGVPSKGYFTVNHPASASVRRFKYHFMQG